MTKNLLREMGKWVCAMTLVLLSAVFAQADYPERTVTLVVPYPAGGSTDIGARIIADRMSEHLGQPVIVENRPGASGLVGAGAVARAQSDGYTLLFTGNGIASAPSMPNANFDLEKDLRPVARVVGAQFAVLANANAPFKTIEEFAEYVKERPGELNVASPGALTAAHLTLEGFRQAAGLEFETIQFAGNAPAAAAMMSGETPAGLDAALSARGAIDAGQLVPLAVTGAERSALLPDVPTLSETVAPGYSGGFSLVMLAPSGTTEEIVEKLNAVIRAILAENDTVEAFMNMGMEPIGSTIEEYRSSLAEEIESNSRIISRLREEGVIE